MFIVYCACSQFLRFLFILSCAESLCAYIAFGVIYNNISNSIHHSRAMPFDLVFGIFLFHASLGKFIVFEIGVELFTIKKIKSKNQFIHAANIVNVMISHEKQLLLLSTMNLWIAMSLIKTIEKWALSTITTHKHTSDRKFDLINAKVIRHWKCDGYKLYCNFHFRLYGWWPFDSNFC